MHLLFCLLILWIFASAAGAGEPTSILELLNRVPVPPASALEAAQWFNKEGHPVHPGLLALKADIAAGNRKETTILPDALPPVTISGKPTAQNYGHMAQPRQAL